MLTCNDRVRVRDLELYAEVGVYPSEYHRKQKLVATIEAEVDLKKAGETDELEDAVDYDAMAQVAREVINEQHHRLIEAIGEKIANRLLKKFQNKMSAVTVTIQKPGAVSGARTVEIEIRRTI